MKLWLCFFLVVLPGVLWAQSEEQDNLDLAELAQKGPSAASATATPAPSSPPPPQNQKRAIVRIEEAPLHEAGIVTATPSPAPTMAKGEALDKNIFTPPQNADQLSVSEQVSVMTKSIKDVPDETIKDNLMARFKDGELKRFLTNNPKVLTFLVRILKDEKALPGLTKLAENKKKLITFAGLMIATFVIAMILKMPLRGSKNNKKALFPFYLRWPFIFILRIVLFLTYFKEEVGPTVAIAKKLFL